MQRELLFQSESLNLSDNSRCILQDITFNIRENEIVTIVGPNGGGKTSLIKVIAGISADYQGIIKKRENLRTAYMPQFFIMNKALPLSVRQFITLRCGRSPKLDWVVRLLQLHNILDSFIHQLSGGELKRALLARCLLYSPELLILDEPTESMDISSRNEFYSMISEVRKELKCSILMASHDLYLVMKDTDRVVCMKNKICCEGTPDRLIKNEDFIKIFGDSVDFYKHHH